MDRPNEGETEVVVRTFTEEDVRRFSELSGDTQPRHTERDDEGRVLVHGLLTASMTTEIGGDLEVLATTMTFDFRRPVYTGNRITCRWTTDRVEERDDRFDVTATVACSNDDETVLTGTVEGLVWKDE